jgi:putative transposase
VLAHTRQPKAAINDLRTRDNPALAAATRSLQNAFVESFNGRLRDEFLNEPFSRLSCRPAWRWKTGGTATTTPDSRIGWLAPAIYVENFSLLSRQGAVVA